jgi:uncharacterized protein YgbK (DUF1537 family)
MTSGSKQAKLLSYYGDDLTGSTDVLEALAGGGIDTVLFTRVPDEAMLERFTHCRAVGLAGTSRSETPAWMDANLPPAFSWLKGLGAAVCHYKVCSTFDSSPAVGNIGRAIEIGSRVFGQRWIPLVVGAPQLRRYTAFGNLFAAFRGRVYRIDRHPVMSRHPVTPMDEADLLVHLSRQTELLSRLVDNALLRANDREARVDAIVGEGDGIVMFDVDDAATQLAAGSEVWRYADPDGLFVAGSSGVEYALMAAWVAQGLAPGKESFQPAPAVERLAVVSGSVSPTTENQIRRALSNGFDGIPLDVLDLLSDGSEGAIAKAVATGLASLAAGRSVILYTALGAGSDLGREIDQRPGARHELGRIIGRMLKRLVVEQKLTRAVIAGGDTSSHALGEVGVDALTVRIPLPDSPGSPLCRAYSGIREIDGLEIALKGGQLGSDAYFSAIRDGTR